MALSNLRRFDVQATYAVVLGCVAVLPFLAAGMLAFTRYNRELGQIVYGSRGMFVPAFLGAVLSSMLPAALAFFLGWNSAGERRNERQGRSWLGFFLGGTVLTLDIILVLAFLMLRLKQPM